MKHVLHHLKNSMFIIYNQVVKPSTLGKAEDVRGWVKARMWFNMVDAQFHESITHLGTMSFQTY